MFVEQTRRALRAGGAADGAGVRGHGPHDLLPDGRAARARGRPPLHRAARARHARDDRRRQGRQGETAAGMKSYINCPFITKPFGFL